jgi:uncharacterized protein YndB with AHSA1/START domain
MTGQTIDLHRTIPAPPERVYRAWLAPETIRRWLAPALFTVHKAEVDERVGGRLRVWHRDAAGTDMGGAEAEILELTSPERIVLRWWFVGPDRVTDPDLETRLTITFARTDDGKTALHLSHGGLDGLRARMPEVADGIEKGWDSTLGILRAQTVLDDPVSQELLNSAIPARMAYTGLDGAPRVVPMGFWWNGREIVVCTADVAPKVRALQADSRLALTIDTEGQPPHVLLIRGTASIEIVDGVPDEYVKASGKLVDQAMMPGFEAQVRSMYERMARISLVPTWAKVLDFETRAPDFVHRLAAKAQAAAAN